VELFVQLLNEVADEKITLSSCLLKAKLLASCLKSRKFRQWVDAELEGYKGELSSVPDYRVIRPQLVGHFTGPFRSAMRNVLLTLDRIPSDIRELIDHHWFRDNIGGLEALLEADTDVFHRRWDITFVDLYRRIGGVRVDGMILQDAESLFSRTAVRGVLHAIRARLLNFLIELSEHYPDLEQVESASVNVPAAETDQIVDRVIYQNCTINGGQAVAKQEINAGGDISVGRDFVVADRISDSFNKFAASGAPEEVKGLVKQLGDAVTAMAQALPPEKAKEAAQDFDTIATEAAKAEPRKGWLKMAGDGLLGAAKIAGEATVGALVAALFQRLGVN
jgi:hypothetical protein